MRTTNSPIRGHGNGAGPHVIGDTIVNTAFAGTLRPAAPRPEAPSPAAERSGAGASTSTSASRKSAHTLRRLRFWLTLAAAAAVALAYLIAPGFRAEVERALAVLGGGDAEAIRAYVLSFGAWAPVVSLLLMLLQAVAAPVPGFLVAFANGLAFGVVWGGALTLVGQTLAAALCFWIARSLGRGPVEALAGKLGLTATDRWLTRWGVPGVLMTRLVPGMAFDAVSYGAGLTGMVFGRFLLATMVGAAPQAYLYAALGRHAPGSAWMLLATTGVVTGGVLAMAFVWRRRNTPRHDESLVREEDYG